MNLLTRTSIENRSRRSARPPPVILPSDGAGLEIRVYNQMMPYTPSLLLGSCRDATDGRGTKASKKKGRTQSKNLKRVAAGKKQPFQLNGVPFLGAIL